MIFNKLESSMSQEWTQVTHKIDSGVAGNWIPFKIYNYLSPKLGTELLCTTKIAQ